MADGGDKTAVVLLSGGLDSATVLAIARSAGFRVAALTFRYGQRHANEVQAAERVARAASGWRAATQERVGGATAGATGGNQSHSPAEGGVIEHRIVDIDLRAFGGSALTADIDVPKDRDERAMAAEIPVTYVPARNTIFLSYALAFAEVRGARDLFIGVNAVDYSGYPDCRPEFVAAFERLANLATRAGVEGGEIRIHAPLIHMSKVEIIRRGLELGVDYGLTRSCYDPDDAGNACGRCDSCRLRLAAFRELRCDDPAPYQ